MTEEIDITGAFEGKTAQLNAEDLVKPLTGRIVRVVCRRATKAKGEQPWDIYLDSWLLPWKPCLTMRRLLRECWGGEVEDVKRYKGKMVTLYRTEVRSPDGGTTMGIRVSHLSDIAGPRDVQLLDGKGTRKTWRVEPLKAEPLTLEAALAAAGLTIADLDAHRAAAGKPPVATLTDEQRSQLARTPAAWPRRNSQ